VSTATTFSATYSDDVGVTSCDFYADSVLIGGTGGMAITTPTPGTATRTHTFITLGSHTAQAKCRDAANNLGSGPVTTITVVENHITGYGQSWQSPAALKSQQAAVEACQHYYAGHECQCGFYCSSVACYASFAVNCGSGAPGWSGQTCCSATFANAQATANSQIIWIYYDPTAWCGWVPGDTGNSYNSCANPRVSWH
jgi:hypothetical protein